MRKPGKYQHTMWLLARPWLTGTIIFILLLSTCSYLVYQHYTIRKNKKQRVVYTVAESIKTRLQQSLQYSLSATQTLALTINRDGIPINFDSVAAYVLSSNKYIDALQLAPAGIIKYVYPLAGNEAVIGYNLLNDPSRNKEAYNAIAKKELIFGGPYQLHQGGLGVVGRLPVFIHNRFWGFSAVVISIPTLLRAAGIDSSGSSGYYQLSKMNPKTRKKEFFLPGGKAMKENVYKMPVAVPDAEWQLSIMPVDGYKLFQAILPLAVLGLILSIIGGIFAAYASKTPARLNQLVNERTVELDKSEKRNKAIVDALPDFAIVINADNILTDYSNSAGHPVIMSPENMLGKNITSFLPAELSQQIIQNKKKVLEAPQIISHSYQLEVEDQLRSYEARYIAQGKEDVLIIIRDVTDAKKSEQRIMESEEKYRTLVEQAADAIFIANFKGEFLVVNPATTKISLYTTEELLSMRMHDLVLADELAILPFKFSEIIAGNTANSERRIRRKDGTFVQVEITARIIAPDRFLAFARDISERKKAETALLKSREDLRHLSNYIENIREQERLHISREIHDEFGQLLTVLKMDVARLIKKIGAENMAAIQDMNEIMSAINNMVAVVRRIASELRPGLLDDLGLLAALDWYCDDFQNRTGIETNFTTSSITEEEFPQELTVGIFRTLQESLANVANHGQASKADISLVRKENELVLLIEDNGPGFETSPTRQEEPLGIMGLKERAIMMGGCYTIRSTPGKGTVVEVVVPFLS